MQTLTEYYNNEENLKEMFNSVENPDSHYWIVENTEGKFRPNKKRINSINKLKNFLFDIRLIEDDGQMKATPTSIPSKVYVSVGQFQHPHTFFGKYPKRPQWVIDDTLFLKSDLLFDLDSENDLSIAHEDGKKIIEFMKSQEDYKLIDIWMSGKKGFNLLYKDINHIIEAHPIKRIQRTEERRKQLIDKLPELKTIDTHHKRIIADQFRVHSVIGSVKAETGYKVRKLTEEEFMLSSPTELIRLTCQRVVRPRPMMGKSSFANTTGEERATLSSNPYAYNFIDNVVKGIKSTIIDEEIDYRYITVLKYPIDRDVKRIINNTQKVYNLDSFYKFIYKDLQMFINLKLVDRRRLEKIMKYSKSINLNSFMFYGHAWIPITKAEDKDGNTVWEKPEFKEVIESDYGINDAHSRPHANLFGLKFNNMAGKETNNICKAMVGEWQ